jgi:AcrR family transcriptional regulator
VTSETVARRASGSNRLSTTDWTARALELLVEEGVSAVKVARLCRELGVTKGSFYWHFEDLEALKKAVANLWCSQTAATLTEMSALGDLPPLERIRIMATQLVDDRSWSVERALRDWARSDAQVAATIAESEQHVFGLVQLALEQLGHDPRSARMRAGLLTYAGIGFAHGQQSLPRPTSEDIDDLVEFLASEAEGRLRSRS